MRTALVLDALEQALWARRREGQGKHKSANRPGTRRAAGSQMPGEPRCQRR
jgi:hypothetical protein